MSWCGGGLMRATPGVEKRTLAIQGQTLWPGSWPPSPGLAPWAILIWRSEEHTSELQSRSDLVCRLLLEKKKIRYTICYIICLMIIVIYRTQDNLLIHTFIYKFFFCFVSLYILSHHNFFFYFFFNDTATTEIYTLSLHDALPI